MFSPMGTRVGADRTDHPRSVSPAGDAGEEQDFTPKPDPAAKVIAHVFKVTSDPFVGKLSYFRVHSGTVRTKADLFLNDSK